MSGGPCNTDTSATAASIASMQTSHWCWLSDYKNDDINSILSNDQIYMVSLP